MNRPVALGDAYKRARQERPDLTTDEFCDSARMMILRRAWRLRGVPFCAASEEDISSLRGASEDASPTLRVSPMTIRPSELAKKRLSLVDLYGEQDDEDGQTSFNGELHQFVGIVHDIPFEDWRQYGRERMTGWAFVSIAPRRDDDREAIVIHSLDGTGLWCPIDRRGDIECESAWQDAGFEEARHNGRLLARIIDEKVEQALADRRLESSDKKLLRNSRRAVRTCLAIMKGLEPREEMIIARALEATFRVADSRASALDRTIGTLDQERGKEQAQKARNAKARKNGAKKDALESAVAAIIGEGPISNHWAKAASIKAKVNRWLADAGFSVVSKDVIARHLEDTRSPPAKRPSK